MTDFAKTQTRAEPACYECGMPGHRFGRTDTKHKYDPTACINMLRGDRDRLRDALKELYEAGMETRMHGDSLVKHVDGPLRATLDMVEGVLRSGR